MNLRARVLRLAVEHPDLQPHLLPLLKQADRAEDDLEWALPALAKAARDLGTNLRSNNLRASYAARSVVGQMIVVSRYLWPDDAAAKHLEMALREMRGGMSPRITHPEK